MIESSYKQLSLLSWTQNYYGLTFYPPYIPLMLKEHKLIETRPRQCNLKLPIKICLQTCSESTWKQVPRQEREFYQELAMEFLGEWNPNWGCIEAVGDLTQCIKMSEPYIQMQTQKEKRLGRWKVGRVAWIIKDKITLPEPIKCRGSQTAPYKIPVEVAQQINEMIHN